MTTDDPRFDLIRRCHEGEATAEELVRLEASLREDPDFRLAYLRYTNLDLALGASATSQPQAKPTTQILSVTKPTHWLSWRPLTAAAAGIVFGMFCTTLVHGLVAQRTATVRATPVSVFDPSLEGIKPLDKGLPHDVDQWGERSSALVNAEEGVQPLSGKSMLRMQPALLGEQDQNRYAHAYQVIDLRSMTADTDSGAREVEIAASFCSRSTGLKSRHYMRVYAVNEPPNVATKDFWKRAEHEGIISMAQRFEVEPVADQWRPFSARMPLPLGTQTLIIVFSASAPGNDNSITATSYLDDVRVTLLTTSTTPEP
jgi:hypothetical protein